MRYAIIVLALLGVLASPRPAAAMTGNDLYAWCENEKNYYLIYIEGWTNRLTAKSLAMRRNDLYSHPEMKICLPRQFTARQSTDICKAHTQQNRQRSKNNGH